MGENMLNVLTDNEFPDIYKAKDAPINDNETAPSPIELTVFTKTGGPLTKKISLAADGSLVKDGSACVMAHGSAMRAKVAGVAGLGALVEKLTPSQALALGSLRADLRDKVEDQWRGASGHHRPQQRQHRLSWPGVRTAGL
jgi:hypothetical protein